MTIEGIGSRSWRIALGEIAPLAAGAAQEEHRVHHLPPRDASRRTTPTGRVEEIRDAAPLLVGQLDGEAHADSLPVGRDSLSGTKRSRSSVNFHTQALSVGTLAWAVAVAALALAQSGMIWNIVFAAAVGLGGAVLLFLGALYTMASVFMLYRSPDRLKPSRLLAEELRSPPPALSRADYLVNTGFVLASVLTIVLAMIVGFGLFLAMLLKL